MSYEHRKQTYRSAYEATFAGALGGYAKIPLVWSFLPLTLSERAMMSAMANIQKPGVPFEAGYRKLGKLSGMDPKTARKAIEGLIKLNYVKLHEKGGKGFASWYVFDAVLTTESALNCKNEHDEDMAERRSGRNWSTPELKVV